MARIGVSRCQVLLPWTEQPQQQAGQAAFPVRAALLAVFADLLVGKGRRRAEPASAPAACQHLPRAKIAQMLPVEGICLGRAQRSCAGSQQPLSLSGRLGCRNEVSRRRSSYSMPTKWRLKLAQDAGNHFLAWAHLHLHPICAATSHAKEQGYDSPWACLVEGEEPFGS